MITAPYNFVPLNEKVFYPDWADEVSHDIPFSDGESGEIEVTITAKSPIFVRDHSNDKDNPSQEFCHKVMLDGSKQFYIPGSSIKGMARSVLEIISFSKMEFVNNETLSVRDMTNRNELVGQANGCGFLKFNADGTGTFIDYTIETQANYKTHYNIRNIKFDQLQKQFTNFNRKDTLIEKYKKIAPYTKIKVSNLKKEGRRYIAEYAQNGEEAYIVCNNYIDGKNGGKKYEFIFCKSDKSNNEIIIEKEIIDKFQTIYFKKELPKKKEDWDIGNFWQNELRNNPKAKELGIPVFVKKSNRGNIQAIGLTQLFKLAYNKTIHQAIKQDTKDNLDLSQTIFGTVKDNFALKGRVQFSHFPSTHVRFEKDRIKEEVLGTPNPSYYPNYIEQTGTNTNKVNSYTTLMDNNAKIRGYKKYPLRKETKSYPLPKDKNEKVNHNVTTKFKPLDKGTTFKGKIRFHNLKKAELGALLSAITFHGQEERYYHNIGMAKPLGYGKIKIDLSLKGLKHTKEEYLKSFEDEITKEIPKWKDSPQLKELFAMADKDANHDDKLVYQQLEKPTGKYKQNGDEITENVFVEAKKSRDYLLPYSMFGKVNPQKPKSNNHKPKSNNHKPNKHHHKPKQKAPTLDDLSNHFDSQKKSNKNRGLRIVKKANKKA